MKTEWLLHRKFVKFLRADCKKIKSMKKLLFVILMLFSLLSFAQETKVLAPTPPMGWNSWNWFGKNDINEKVALECMDAMVDEGLLDAGYQYFVIDGGWRDTHLNEKGELLAHPEKFPHGIKFLADYAHSRGLKFGLHTVPGTNDCGGDKVGGYGHEKIQVQEFVRWGLDFIKLDRCQFSSGWNEELIKKTYEKWHNLFLNSGRDIILNISAYKFRVWNPQICQMSRTTGDIGCKSNKELRFQDTPKGHRRYNSVMAVAEENNKYRKFAGNGYWNDPDMLVVGNPGLTIEEQKIHFALWCIMTSPLFLGNDPRKITPEEKAIITNGLAISIDQDPTEQGGRVKKEGHSEIWMKKLRDGSRAVLLLNRDSVKSHKIQISLKEIGLSGKRKVIDVYNEKCLGNNFKSVSKKIQPQSGLFLLIK